MASDTDLIVECVGQNAPSTASSVPIGEYQMALSLKGLKRSLLNLSPGSTPDVATTRDSVMKQISTAVGGNFARLGGICLIGDSNGAGTVLSIAKALQATAAPKPLYVAVGDLTLFPFGRDPPVPGIGRLVPKNTPNIGWGQRLDPGFRGTAANAAIGDYPLVDDPGIVADLLDNYFTAEGNRVRYFGSTPKEPNGGWWWTSSMNSSEVHGWIDSTSWRNTPITTTSTGSAFITGPGSIDDGHHGNLCMLAMNQMRPIAGQKLRGFVLRQP
jgi:hypothetical protein